MRITCLSMALMAAAGVAQGATVSTFDAGAEGWSVVTVDTLVAGQPVGGTATPLHVATGNPGGALQLTDPDSFDFYFAAPAAFLGDRSAAAGGTLSYDLWTDVQQSWNGPAVILKGGGKTLVYQFPASYSAQNQWVNLSMVLAPSAEWDVDIGGGTPATAADFQTVLGNLTALWITGETANGVFETSRLDNVSLPAADGQVPEPATLLLMAAAAAALSLRRRA